MNKKGEYKFLVADHDTDLVQVVRVSSSASDISLCPHALRVLFRANP